MIHYNTGFVLHYNILLMQSFRVSSVDVGHQAEPRNSRVLLCSILYIFASTSILAYSTWYINDLTWYQSHLLIAMIFCSCDIFKSNLCLPRCFFAAFIFFGFLLLPSKLFGIVMPPLKVASTLQNYCLHQTTVTESNFIQGIFSTLSNFQISSSFHLEFERGCQKYISLLA